MSWASSSVLRAAPAGALSRSSRYGVQLHSITQRRRFTNDLDKTKGDRERIVVLGSGWAGYTLARDLDSRKYQVIVVSPRSYFVFTPLLASCSVGTLEYRTALEPVRSRRTNVEFYQGWADEVDFAKKTLSIEEAVENPWQGYALTGDLHEGESRAQREEEKKVEKRKGKLFEMGWDKLVVAVGCYSQTFGTKGVKEHAYFLKDVGDARKIRNRMLSCFETASLPTTSEAMKEALLNFAVVGGGPTGIEFSAELHDIVSEDMAKLYPDLRQYAKITVYDVADKVLSMFDEKLSTYAMKTFNRQGIDIKTSHHVEELRVGAPGYITEQEDVKESATCYTLKLKEAGEVGVGMCVWSTGLMQSPFVAKTLREPYQLPPSMLAVAHSPGQTSWRVTEHSKTGAIITNDRLRVTIESSSESKDKIKAIMKDVFALGDCGMIKDTMYPATAQVANQKARWLAKRLNKGDIETQGFTYKDLGVMAYIGNWNAIMQTGGGDISGRVAWLLWRGAYLAKSVSWRNRILIPTYWFVNWLFGRDISRF